MELNTAILLKCQERELWEWLTNFEKLQKWNTSMIEEKNISSGEVRVGFVTKVLIKEGRKSIWYESEILDYQPNRSLSISLKGGNLGKSPMVINYQIKKQRDLLELSYTSSWKPVGVLLWLMHPLIKKISTKNLENSLSELKKQIEN